MAEKKPSGRNLAQKVVQEMITEEEWRKAAQSLWEIATTGVRPEWETCPGCHRRVQVSGADLRARTDALARLQEMGFGKPKEEAAAERGFVLNRIIVVPSS